MFRITSRASIDVVLSAVAACSFATKLKGAIAFVLLHHVVELVVE